MLQGLSRNRRLLSSDSLSVGVDPLLFGAGFFFVCGGPLLFGPGSLFVVAPLLFGDDLLLFVVGRHLLLGGDLLLLGGDPLLFGDVLFLSRVSLLRVGGDSLRFWTAPAR